MAAAEAAPRPRQIRLDLGVRYETLSDGLSDWYQEAAQITVRARKTTRVFLGVDQYRRFDRDDTQLTLGAAQNFPHDVTLSALFTLGIDVDVVARQIYAAELAYRLTRWATPLLAYRHSSYPGHVLVNILAPGVEVVWWPYLSVLGRYYYSHSSVSGDAHAGSVKLTAYPEHRLSGYVGVAYGGETFLAGTVVQAIQRVDVLTLAAGAMWRVGEWGGVRLDYAYEDRRGSYYKHGIGAGIFVEF